MPEHCAAFCCSNRRTSVNKARGITFHKFPKDRAERKKWEVAVRRVGFTASGSTVLCSAHFKQSDLDRTGQTVRLRDRVIPSVFSFPAHRQRLEKGRATATSRRAEESLSIASRDSLETATSHPLVQPIDDHGYALPVSPAALKTRLENALARVESLEREEKNAMAREKRARTTLPAPCPSSLQQSDAAQPLDERETPSTNQNGESEEAPPPTEIKPIAASLPLPPHDPETPIGVEHVKMGYYCRVCFLFYSNEETAKKQHCSSQTHYDKLQKHLEKEAAKAEKKKSKKTSA